MKVVACTYWFKSESNPRRTYETLEYEDGTTSCSCPGWCRRVDANGNRSCKHTRLVLAGRAAADHLYTGSSGGSTLPRHQQPTTKPTAPVIMPKPGQRKMII